MFDHVTTLQAGTELTIHTLLAAVHRLQLAGKLVYATHGAVSPGKVFFCEESDMNYAFYIFHDEAAAAQIADELRLELLHIRDAPDKVLAHPPQLRPF